MKTKQQAMARRRRNSSQAAEALRPARNGSKTETTRESVTPLTQIKSILVPIDFSAPSKKALEYAVPFAKAFGAKLTLVHVVEPVATPDFANSFPLVMEDDRVLAKSKSRLEMLVLQQGIDPALVERVIVRAGRAFHEIADAARSLKCDLIVISTHGYTGLKHVLLGSTTERVVRHAACPVLVVREDGKEIV